MLYLVKIPLDVIYIKYMHSQFLLFNENTKLNIIWEIVTLDRQLELLFD